MLFQRRDDGVHRGRVAHNQRGGPARDYRPADEKSFPYYKLDLGNLPAPARPYEHLPSVPDHEALVLGQAKFKEIVATAAWYLWWERRKFRHDEPIQTPNQIQLAVRTLAGNFTLASYPNSKVKRGGWTKPIRGYVKFNVDYVLILIHSKLLLELFFVMIRVSLLQPGMIALTFALML